MRKSESAGVLARVRTPMDKLAPRHTLFISQRESERKRGRERERKGDKEEERCTIWFFLLLKGMTGALAQFSYLVFIIKFQ